MKKLVIIVLLSLTTQILFAQEFARPKQNRLSKLIIGLITTPEYLSCIDEAPKNENYEFEYKNKLTFGFGIDIWYEITDNVYFQTGVAQSYRKFNRKELCYDCANGFSYESDFRLTYLDIPLGISYKAINKRLDLILNGALIGSILRKGLENRNSITGSFYDFDVKPFYNKFLAGFQAGVGTNYNLTYRLSVGLLVDYKMYFNRTTDQVAMKWRGLSTTTGIYYKF